jgi:hypothetical protein
MPTKRFPARMVATPVVPLPMKGSRIVLARTESQKYRTWLSGRGQGTGLPDKLAVQSSLLLNDISLIVRRVEVEEVRAHCDTWARAGRLTDTIEVMNLRPELVWFVREFVKDDETEHVEYPRRPAIGAAHVY